MSNPYTCPCCLSNNITSGLCIDEVPAHSVRLHTSKASAIAEPLGELNLVGCETCGFVFNASYDPTLHRYDSSYESTQSFSQTFNAFNKVLARSILEATVADGPVVEIGCGNGELLSLFAELGARSVVGFDPAFSPEHAAFIPNSFKKVLAHYFSPKDLTEPASAIVSKMTLEHVADPLAFLKDIARAIPVDHDTRVFIQVPNAQHVFGAQSIGDLLYEHCNYFTAQSLDRAFSLAGLQTLEMETAFDDQYLHAVARLANPTDPKPKTVTQGDLAAFQSFASQVRENARLWREWISQKTAAGHRLAFWGGASKAVGFLSLTGSGKHFRCAIDINPRKSGSYLPATGIEIVSPDAASHMAITDILVCNPIYMGEIQGIADQSGISAVLHPMGATPPKSRG